ncbi:craniofacial development protein 2-like [Daktulosphaira vitifoliae]|uniref:craniofacial development protein 2-like n=1 Tax=Daktulosphaira vitifoliae TaxID=58002 RepID=UPI0021A9930A|nr:craniofacial development protein 2-like [Daktulosphaira vitifoliae]
MDEEMKSRVVKVARKSDRILVVELIFEEKVLNVISAYVLQVGCDEIYKEVFWREMDEVMQGVPGNMDVVIGGDMNGHVGNEWKGNERVHGGYGFSENNEAGERILDFAVSYDLAVVSTYFRKREEHYIIYKSGNNRSQIDYLMWKSESVKRVKNCKVILGESVTTQHRLMVMEFWCTEIRIYKN